MSGSGAWAAVVMGVSGSGKTVVGERLARLLDAPFVEGDALHDARAVAAMRAGTPLTDEDRWPWLDRVGEALTATAEEACAVGACSALKRRYRERLSVAAAGTRLRFVWLAVDGGELRRRLAQRQGHFMPASLLPSQLAALEPPGADEDALVLDAHDGPDALAQAAATWLERG